MSLFPGLSLLRVAGRATETNCCSETQRLSVLSVKPWTEASRVLHRRRRCLTLCCLQGPRITAVLCVSREEVGKEPHTHSKVFSAITVGDKIFMTPVKLRTRATYRGPPLARKQLQHCTGEGREAPLEVVTGNLTALERIGPMGNRDECWAIWANFQQDGNILGI
ncbi:hypothetical protein NDU88_008340 [Pleurodeles waltl]|uniref:Uncharacterized protein n=1 Tax=Pleurodeles waltl TaxID=8319 RepID=A0AAV7RSV8_PLEWA|nr:hypothetical protein NDU88_008340 [Pleurodeles waltl]